MYVFLKSFRESVLVFANGRLKWDIKEKWQARILKCGAHHFAANSWGYCED